MEATPTESFNALVENYLGERLPDKLANMVAFETLPPNAQEIIVRMLALMKRAAFPVTEFNTYMLWLLGTVTPAMLPSAWGGRIPPLTASGRHKKLDAYVSGHNWDADNGRGVFVDLGCGFPPVTTTDTAKALPAWSVFGVDRLFAAYVLYDPDGNYACFNEDGAFLYLQPLKKPLHENRKTVRTRFEALFADLSPHLQANDAGASTAIEKDGARLVYNHVRDFETPNLRFVEAEIEGLRLPSARVVRCMNVLLYFDKTVRQKMRRSTAAILEDGGLMISGFNDPFGIYARYAVNKKTAAGLEPFEFAFSLENLRPLGFGPWVTIADQDEDAELLADLTGAIRADRRFWPDFNRYVDELQAANGIGRRDADGFIQFTEEMRTAPPQVVMAKTRALWRQLDAEGYTDGAVDALNRAGYRAWKNQVGDIAVVPPAGPPPAGDEMSLDPTGGS